MTQPTLSPGLELAALLARYDHGALPPGIAARVAELRHAQGLPSVVGCDADRIPEGAAMIPRALNRLLRQHERLFQRYRAERLADIIGEAQARFEALTPDEQRQHREAQRRSWVRGELMLEHPAMTAAEADALIEKAQERGLG